MSVVQAGERVTFWRLFSGFASGRDFFMANLFIGFEVFLKALEIWFYYLFGQLLAEDKSRIILIAVAIILTALIRLIVSGSISLFGEYWRVSVVKSILDSGVTVLRDRPDLYPERTLRHERPTAIASSSYLTSENLVSLYLSLVRSGFGLLAYIVAFAVFFGTTLSLAFVVGLIVSHVLNHKVQSHLAQRAAKTETSRIKVTSLYDTVWDNIVIGNGLWASKWIDRLHQTYERYRFINKVMCRHIFFIQLVHIVMSYVLAIAAFVWLLVANRTDAAFTLSLVVVVPKIIQGLQQQSDFIAHTSVLGVLKGQLDIVRDAISPLQKRDLLARLNRLQIDIAPSRGDDDQVAALLQAVTSGHVEKMRGQRLTIRGANGAGKTSLLLYLKEKLGAPGFYLPAQMKATMNGSDIGHSTGEYMLKTLHEALAAPDRPRIFLLDEWDAHLDGDNVGKIDRLLDQVSGSGATVIEVRHRKQGGG